MSWIIVFLGFSALIVLHEAGHFFAAKATGMRVEKFFLFMGPKLVSVKRGETEYGIAALPIGGYVKITGMNPEEELPDEVQPRAYYRKPVWQRIVVIAAGPAVNIVLAFLILFSVYYLNAQQVNQKVSEISAGAPAAAVLKKGDRIVAVDGKSYPDLDSEARLTRFGEDVAAHKCAGKQTDGCRSATAVKLGIVRDGQAQTVLVRPEFKKEYGRALVGFSYGSRPDEIGVGIAASRAASSIWFVTHKTASIFSRIFESEQRKQISGIVGISDVAHQTVQKSTEKSLLLLALVSLSLGLINLLPILPLDGGHIFWSLMEKLRGRPVSLKVMERATVAGILFVVLLMFIGLSNDLGRLGGEGFNVR
jgi:regulator of sigma E protease